MYNKILQNSYEKVANQTRLLSSFDEKRLKESKEYFTKDEFDNYIPKRLSVEAVLSGIEFSTELQTLVKNLQSKIDSIINTKDRYWVETKNLGVEYFVTKWPENDERQGCTVDEIIEKIEQLNLEKFEIKISGFQINPDGCVVMRGYDNGVVQNIRNNIFESFPNLPIKQSQWVHIPIGRILTQIESNKFIELVDFFESSVSWLNFSEMIYKLHYVKEHRWYMTEKDFLFTHHLM